MEVKICRISRVQSKPPLDALRECLEDYQAPVSLQVMKAQIQLAIQEASDLEFVPPAFRNMKV
ncbi:MAG: hypothetical protein NTX50_16840 [Candidatus Sumerlaeota bacterium]|nr:hypothetical protein [Candidatus Sumerlaeota bacterium]